MVTNAAADDDSVDDADDDDDDVAHDSADNIKNCNNNSNHNSSKNNSNQSNNTNTNNNNNKSTNNTTTNNNSRSRPELRLLFLPLSFTACDAQSHSHAFLCPSTRETGCAELLLPGRAFRRRSREGRRMTTTFELGCQRMLYSFPRDGEIFGLVSLRSRPHRSWLGCVPQAQVFGMRSSRNQFWHSTGN